MALATLLRTRTMSSWRRIETRDRLVTAVVTVAPVAGLGFVAWQVWGDWLHRGDLVVFAILYLTTGLGITVGFHRHLTHRAFATTRPVRAVLAVLGSAAIEGPVISWVADHRKHHAFADVEGDPHSPHVGHGRGWRGAIAGLLHAHVGWLFVHTQRGARRRYAPDLLADPIITLIDRTFVVWALGGLAAAFGLGCAIGGTAMAGVSGLLWGGAVRMPGASPCHLQHQLAVPFLRPPPVRDARSFQQRVLARAAIARGVLA